MKNIALLGDKNHNLVVDSAGRSDNRDLSADGSNVGALVVLSTQLSQTSSQLRALAGVLEEAQDADQRGDGAEQGVTLPALQRQLTEAEASEIVRLYLEGTCTLRELGEQFGLHRNTIGRVLRDANVRVRRRPMTSDETDEATKRYSAGQSLRAIGTEMSLPSESVRRTLISLGVVMRGSWERG